MRGLIVGGVCSLTIGLLAPWAIYVMRGSYMALDYSTPAAIALFFLLALANRWLHLTKRDMVIAYTMMVVACVVPTGGVLAPLLALSTGAIYYADSGNDWISLVGQYLPDWVAPHKLSIPGLYEGGGAVFWPEWIVPLFSWAILFGGLYLVMVGGAVLLRKQWVENERLSYPLTALPIALIEGGILRNWRFWAGIGVPFIAGSLIGLNYYFPGVPTLRVSFGAWPLPLRLSFPALGFFYLTSLHTGLSLWVFTLAGECIQKGFTAIGLQAAAGGAMPYGADSIFAMYLGAGALLCMVGMRLRNAREYWGKLWRHDPKPFRLCGIGLGVMVVWLCLAGIPPYIVIFFLPVAIAIFIGMARVVAETGIAVAGAPAIAPVLTVGLLGHRLIGAAGIANLAQSFAWTAESTRVSVMASAGHSLKVLTHYKQDCRAIWRCAGWAIVLAGAAALWLTLTYGYSAGLGPHWYFNDCIRYTYTWAADWNTHQYGPSKIGWLLVGGGGLLYWALSRRYLFGAAGAIHPIGLTVIGSYFMRLTWFSCVLAWAIKAIMARWGVWNYYTACRPFFLGLICGQYTVNLIWLGIDKLTGHTGNMIFWV